MSPFLLSTQRGAVVTLTLNSPSTRSAGLQALAHKTPQHVEAVNAFVEKRKPDFSGL